MGFPAVFSVSVEDGGAFEEIRGVEVDTVMVSGRMVPAIAGDEASRMRQDYESEYALFRGAYRVN